MLKTNLIGNNLKIKGYKSFIGVPCSFLKSLINYSINYCDYIGATNEGEAIAIASGMYVGGGKSIVLMQNSGLANALSPLVSLNYTFKIPLLGFISLRGESGLNDEPQHKLMGEITTDLLDLIKIKWKVLSSNQKDAKKQINEANSYIEKNKPFFFIVLKNTFSKESIINKNEFYQKEKKIIRKIELKDNFLPKRLDVLKAIDNTRQSKTIILTTTGKTGRELYQINDSKQNFYMVGSMGCISSFGLGLSIMKKKHKVIVIDGDGSLLMRLGSLATNAYYNPSNMLHILLDNKCHDSTGAQKTVSNNIDFIKIANSCGYKNSIYANNVKELINYTREWYSKQGLTFLYISIDKGSMKNLGRPKIKPSQVKERLMEVLDYE